MFCCSVKRDFLQHLNKMNMKRVAFTAVSVVLLAAAQTETDGLKMKSDAPPPVVKWTSAKGEFDFSMYHVTPGTGDATPLDPADAEFPHQYAVALGHAHEGSPGESPEKDASSVHAAMIAGATVAAAGTCLYVLVKSVKAWRRWRLKKAGGEEGQRDQLILSFGEGDEQPPGADDAAVSEDTDDFGGDPWSPPDGGTVFKWRDDDDSCT